MSTRTLSYRFGVSFHQLRSQQLRRMQRLSPGAVLNLLAAAYAGGDDGGCFAGFAHGG